MNISKRHPLPEQVDKYIPIPNYAKRKIKKRKPQEPSPWIAWMNEKWQ